MLWVCILQTGGPIVLQTASDGREKAPAPKTVVPQHDRPVHVFSLFPPSAWHWSRRSARSSRPTQHAPRRRPQGPRGRQGKRFTHILKLAGKITFCSREHIILGEGSPAAVAAGTGQAALRHVDEPRQPDGAGSAPLPGARFGWGRGLLNRRPSLAPGRGIDSGGVGRCGGS